MVITLGCILESPAPTEPQSNNSEILGNEPIPLKTPQVESNVQPKLKVADLDLGLVVQIPTLLIN